jgi:hypothetical protein
VENSASLLPWRSCYQAFAGKPPAYPVGGGWSLGDLVIGLQGEWIFGNANDLTVWGLDSEKM